MAAPAPYVPTDHRRWALCMMGLSIPLYLSISYSSFRAQVQ